MKEKLDQELSELADAEDFLDYFQIPYDPHVVDVSRLHILQRFHDYLQRAALPGGVSAATLREHYRGLLEQAYQDFVHSSPGEEKVFDVFHRALRQVVHIPVETLFKSQKLKR